MATIHGGCEERLYHVWVSMKQRCRERLREFVVSLADAFNINGEWADPRWCLSGCMHMFKCHPTDEETETRCPAWARLRELGAIR